MLKIHRWLDDNFIAGVRRIGGALDRAPGGGWSRAAGGVVAGRPVHKARRGGELRAGRQLKDEHYCGNDSSHISEL